MSASLLASRQVPAATLSITTVEKNISTFPRRSGNFTLTGLSGLTAGKQVIISQATGPYTGKGTLQDESEMDNIDLKGYVVDATTIKVQWASRTMVKGNFKFNYFIQN